MKTNENTEPVGASADRGGMSSERGHEQDAGLARIVSAWEGLPAVLKGAMLAIVDSAGAVKREASGETRLRTLANGF